MIDRDLIRADRAQGMTYEQIGKKYGVTRQRINQLIGGDTDRVKNYFRTLTEKDCIYPNLRKWMNDNKCSKTNLARRIFGNAHPNNQNYLSKWLRGQSNPIKKSIDKLIEVTGLTYEELFKE